jgi:hypothetical protein
MAWRHYRHRTTGELALLTIGLAHPPGGPFYAVIAARPDRSNIPGAREVWRQRELELQAAGYERS